jgi:hypothetical protein
LVRFVAVGHNLERGAAGGSLLLAELAMAEGLLERRPTAAGAPAGRAPGIASVG